jgi:peptidoglycan/LPS O-acetylase OafA/YrhL
MRAVAVLGVVIYHAFPWMLPGGLIGVDIFFVISGYLISGILYKGHQAGNFSFKVFYARRIRMLFPALIIVLLICLGYGWLILLPDEFQQLGKHVAAGTVFIQNFVFWQESGYFDTVASLKPLLHLWSLAVEEQFYIFFPLLLLLLWKKPKILAPAMGVLLIGTFILNVVMSVQNSTTDFFLTPYRAWEFLGGSLLAWWHYDKGHEEEVPLYREAMSWGGVLLLGVGMAFIHTGDAYPGWRALLPVAGTLLLMEGGRGAWVNRKILSNPAVVWVGLISYPLYLFHWPALSFVHIVKGANPKAVYLVDALIIALILTVLTYYFIEKKIRHNKSKAIIPVLVGAFIATGITGVQVFRNGAICKSEEILKIEEARKDWIGEKCLIKEWEKNNIICSSYGGGIVNTILIGDSNIQQYAPRIKELLDHNSIKNGLTMLSYAGAPPISGVTNHNHYQSSELAEELYKSVNQNKNTQKVVIGCLWTWYFRDGTDFKCANKLLSTKEGSDIALSNLKNEINNLIKKGIKVYVILNIPLGDELDPQRWFKRNFTGYCVFKAEKLSVSKFDSWSSKIINNVKKTCIESGAEIIDPVKYLVKDGFCISEYNNGPIHFDYSHLRADYVRYNIKYLDNIILQK